MPKGGEFSLGVYFQRVGRFDVTGDYDVLGSNDLWWPLHVNA